MGRPLSSRRSDAATVMIRCGMARDLLHYPARLTPVATVASRRRVGRSEELAASRLRRPLGNRVGRSGPAARSLRRPSISATRTPVWQSPTAPTPPGGGGGSISRCSPIRRSRRRRGGFRRCASDGRRIGAKCKQWVAARAHRSKTGAVAVAAGRRGSKMGAENTKTLAN